MSYFKNIIIRDASNASHRAYVSHAGAVLTQDILYAIAGGFLPGYSSMLKFGRNPDIDTAAAEDIWEGGGAYPFQSTAQSLEVLSDSTSDTSTGVGARTITLIGLDASLNEATQTITLNGTSAVAITGTWLRVHRCSVTTAGTSAVNVGTLTVRIAGGGTTLLVVGPGNGQTLMAVYTIPAGYTGFMFKYYVSANAGATAPVIDLRLFTRSATGIINLKHQQALAAGAFTHTFAIPFKIPEKNDIYMNATTNTNNTDVCGGFDLVVISNEHLSS